MRRLLATTLLALLAAAPAGAEVTDAGPTGFTSRNVHELPVPPEQVWAAFHDIGAWWNGAHSWSADAANLHLDPVAGGVFGETLPGGGSVVHMTVIHAAPGALLRLQGALGPLQEMAVTGVLSFALKPLAAGTELTATYAVGGYAEGGLEKIAPAVDYVINEQCTRLKAHLGG